MSAHNLLFLSSSDEKRLRDPQEEMGHGKGNNERNLSGLARVWTLFNEYETNVLRNTKMY
ncbi:hypothetical protein E2C01_039947 [Portunus trituberculatus]|uniref:Uncharacterized protein n=1 Tax=Portunus trituberculatus TaxID=210409 RepID=A0A5B7FM97_PORTR|nr:hypothetical protein [Portunus trituberculatus]